MITLLSVLLGILAGISLGLSLLVLEFACHERYPETKPVRIIGGPYRTGIGDQVHTFLVVFRLEGGDYTVADLGEQATEAMDRMVERVVEEVGVRG